MAYQFSVTIHSFRILHITEHWSEWLFKRNCTWIAILIKLRNSILISSNKLALKFNRQSVIHCNWNSQLFPGLVTNSPTIETLLLPRCKRKQHSMDKDKLDCIQSHNSSIRILWLSIRFVSSSSIFTLSIQKFTCKESRFSYNDLWLHFISLQRNSSSSSSSPIRCMLNKINGSQRRRLFRVYKLLS